MDVSDRAKTEWKGEWIWSSNFSPRQINFLGGRPKPPGPEKTDLNSFVLMRHIFTASNAIKGARLNITADSRYKVFINGNYIGRGVNRCEANYWNYDMYDVSDTLVQGKNVVAIRARWFGLETAYYTFPEHPGVGKAKAAKGGVLFEIDVTYASGKRQCFGSGNKTKVIQDPSEEQDVPLKNGTLGYIEVIDTSKLSKKWNEIDFNDSSWKQATVLDYPIKNLLRDYNSPRTERFHCPKRILNIGECEDCIVDLDEEDVKEMDFNVFHKIEAAPTRLKHFETLNLEGVTRQGEVVEILPKEGSENRVVSLFLQFEKEMVGYPQLVVNGGKGTIIDLIPSEKKYNDHSPALDCIYNKRGARFVLRGGKQFLEQWLWVWRLWKVV